MSELTEREILGRLKESFKLASEDADRLAAGERGPVYRRFREHLKLVEGCCRQMSAWRGDTRWLQVGLKVAEAQQKCGKWLRTKELPWRFAGLAQILRNGWLRAHELETKKTGRPGLILPKPLPAETRTQGRSVSVILPPGFIREGEAKH